MAKFSWDEFAGGVAAGGIAGLNQGTDLARAREAAKENRLRTLLTFPDEVAGLAGAEKEASGGMGSVMDTGIATGAGDPYAPIRSAAAQIDPRQGDISRARGMFAQSDRTNEILDSMTDQDIKNAKMIKEIKKRQIQGDSIKTVATEFANTGKLLDIIAERANSIGIEINQADAAGDAEKVEVLKQRYDQLGAKKEELRIKQMTNSAALSGLGLEVEDIDKLRQTQDKGMAIQFLIEKYTGGGKTRKPGARGR